MSDWTDLFDHATRWRAERDEAMAFLRQAVDGYGPDIDRPSNLVSVEIDEGWLDAIAAFLDRVPEGS